MVGGGRAWGSEGGECLDVENEDQGTDGAGAAWGSIPARISAGDSLDSLSEPSILFQE